MWTILIVEDEAHVRKSLRKNIDWAESGFEVIGEASNGLQALKFIEQHEPDLVICDIMMPLMNGIELLKQARDTGLQSLFVMLTCMNEFEYAQSALQYDAFDYALKLSMDVDSLRRILSKADAELQRNAKQTALQLFYEYQPLYQEMWSVLTDAKENQAAEMQLDRMKGTLPQVLICSVLHGNADYSIDDFIALEIMELDKRTLIHSFSAMGQTTLFIWSQHEIKVKPVYGREAPFSTVIGPSVSSAHIYEAWRSTLRKLDDFWYSGQKGIEYLKAEEWIPESYRYVSWKKERKLIQYFEQAKLDECEVIIQEIWQRMRQSVSPMYVVKDIAIQFNSWFLRIADHPIVDTDELSSTTDHEELLSILLRRLGMALDNGQELQQSWTDHIEINKILEYINEHYDENISLISMAQFVSLEKNYLSSLFKNKAGVNLIHYLHSVRIAKAKYFLENTNLTVHEVGERVGFPNNNYFIKIFRRWTKTTPHMYRQDQNS